MDKHPQEVIVRAWKDETYRQSLPSEVRDELPPRPGGMGELSDEDLEQAAGGVTPAVIAGAGLVGGVSTLVAGVDAVVDDAGVQGD